jgi:hypothetical protein
VTPHSRSRKARSASCGVLLIGIAACGGSSPQAASAPAATDPSHVGDASTPSAASSASAKAPDKAVVEQCFAAARASRARFSGEPAKVGARHVLVKYKGAKNAEASVTRTREEACLRAMDARDQARSGVDFADVVKQYSDEAGADSRHGSIGVVTRQDLARPFADALFELSVNQLSDIVETDSGFHVILRTE